MIIIRGTSQGWAVFVPHLTPACLGVPDGSIISDMSSSGTKVWVFLLALSVSVLILGQHLGGRVGLLLGFFFAVALNATVFTLGESRILSRLHARRLQGRDAWGLRERVAALSARLDIKPPLLFVMESPTATAFSVGFPTRQPCLCLSTGLLEKFDHDEIDAVLAQQLCTIGRMDSFGFGVTGLLANTVLGIGQVLDTLWPPNFFLDRKQKPFLTLVSPLGWLIIRAVVRPSKLSENDRAAAELIQSRHRVGEILWRLDGLAQARPLAVPPGTSHLFIVNPEGLKQRNFFLRAHTPMADRLRRLIGTPTV